MSEPTKDGIAAHSPDPHGFDLPDAPLADIGGEVPSSWYLSVKQERDHLRALYRVLDEAEQEHLRTGDYLRLGMKAQDALRAFRDRITLDRIEANRGT